MSKVKVTGSNFYLVSTVESTSFNGF
jgi:hypothetical protein